MYIYIFEALLSVRSITGSAETHSRRVTVPADGSRETCSGPFFISEQTLVMPINDFHMQLKGWSFSRP